VDGRIKSGQGDRGTIPPIEQWCKWPLLVLASRGAAALAAIAGALALALIWPERAAAWHRVRLPALLLVALLVWGLVSTFWAVDPRRSLLMTLRLTGLFVAGMALTAAAPGIVAPRRLIIALGAGLVLALALTALQLATRGGLTGAFSRRAFAEPALNQVENALALLLLPLAAMLIARGRFGLAALAAAAMAAALLGLAGTTARFGFALGCLAALLLWLAPRSVARIAAAVSVVAILTAPLTFARFDDVPAIHDFVHGLYKWSARHRLEIWSFVGARIDEKPLAGWGLDASRHIPGGDAPIPDGFPWQKLLPLHPHNQALQVWLELGLPGAVLFAVFAARLWLALAGMGWPRLFAAAAGGSLAAAQTIGAAAYGMWEEWWIGTQFLALFLILVMARRVAAPAPTPSD
jgi:O-antigen ligase